MLFFPSQLNFILIFLRLSGFAFSSNIELKMYTFNYDLFLGFQGTSYYKYHVEKLDRTGKIVYSM